MDNYLRILFLILILLLVAVAVTPKIDFIPEIQYGVIEETIIKQTIQGGRIR